VGDEDKGNAVALSAITAAGKEAAIIQQKVLSG
jgi:hypothetical protein